MRPSPSEGPWRLLGDPGAARAFARPVAVPWLEALLKGYGEIHLWAGSHPARRALGGRGETWSVPAPDGASGRWVVRHYCRGGLAAGWLGDRYLAVGEPRPFAEARASQEARRRGIPTPEVVAGAVYPDGIFYRADLVTEEIPHATDLASLLASPPTSVTADDALAAAGILVRRLESEGIVHPDLHAGNVVIQTTGDGAQAHVVDLDRCRVRSPGVPAPAFPMRRRLERSLRKLERRRGTPLSSSAWDALRTGFMAS